MQQTQKPKGSGPNMARRAPKRKRNPPKEILPMQKHMAEQNVHK